MTLFDPDDPVVDPNKDYLTELVGDDKKFKSPQELARAKAEADAFIERLKTEAAGLRSELQTRMKLEEAVEKLQSKQTPPSSEQEPKAHEQGSKPALTPEELEVLIQKTLEQNNQKTQRQRNVEAVEQALKEAFGPTYRRTVTEQAKKLGLGEDFLTSLAADQPAAFLKLLDVQKQPEVNSTAVTPPRSSFNDAMGWKPGDNVKRQSFYNKMRKTDPSRYWSVSVQNEIHREAQRQGETFFDT